MCDDDTEADNAVYLERAQLNRRQMSRGAGAVVAAWMTGCKPTASPAPPVPTKSPVPTKQRMVSIDTPHGTAEAFFVAPSGGRHPGVIVWPDIAGLRDAFKAMAVRLAEAGYAVLAVNQYYRSAKMPLFSTFSEWRTDEGKATIAPMAEALTAEAITADGVAFAGWLDAQAEVDTDKKLATSGYCMGGPFTFRTAAAAATRVGVLASFHGGGLVTEAQDSPHRLLPQIKAAALICVAQNDDARRPQTQPTLRQAAQEAGVTAEIDVYPAGHGWCVPDSPVYDEVQAERAWTAMLAVLDAHL